MIAVVSVFVLVFHFDFFFISFSPNSDHSKFKSNVTKALNNSYNASDSIEARYENSKETLRNLQASVEMKQTLSLKANTFHVMLHNRSWKFSKKKQPRKRK